MLDIAIIIVSWNVREYLTNCLRSVFGDLARSGLRGEVWVVDNASTDGTVSQLADLFPQVHVITNHNNPGFGAANNQGMATAAERDPRYFFLLNPDTVVQPGAIGHLVRCLDERPNGGVATARLIYGDGRFQHSAFTFPGISQLAFDLFKLPDRLYESRLNGRYAHTHYHHNAPPFAVDHPLGAAMLVRADVVQVTGGFDESYHMYCEEIDWSWRIRAAGWSIFAVPQAEITHYGGESTKQIPAQSVINLWRSRAQLYRRLYKGVRFTVAARLVKLEMARRAKETADPDLRRAYEHVVELWSGGAGEQGSRGAGESLAPENLQSPVSAEAELSAGAELSAVVLTLNEAHNIDDCIKSLRWADRIIVFDSHSQDGTVDVARQAGVEVLQSKFENYAQQRNAALAAIETDWVFFVDADERGTVQLRDEIRHVINQCPEMGWYVPRHNYIFGKLTRHTGWYPDYQLRLFKHGQTRYERPVHEVAVVAGEIGHLQNPLIHYNYMDRAQFHKTQRAYTSYDAKILKDAGVRARPHNFVLQPLRQFYWRFVTLKGYKDGLHGLRLSLLMMYYEWVKYRKLAWFWRKR
jgi:GT2 family glycosyltransferase